MESNTLAILIMLSLFMILQHTAKSQQPQGEGNSKIDSLRSGATFAFDSLGVFGEARDSRDTVYSERDASTGMMYLGGKGDLWGVVTLVKLLLSTEWSKERQDINQYAVEGSSDWARVWVGDHHPDYGELSISGLRVRGTGISLRPGKFRMDLNVGQAQRAIEGDSLTGRSGTYRRWLYGARIGYEHEQDLRVLFSFVRMRDDLGSISNAHGALAQENMLSGLEIRAKLSDALMYTGEFAGSVHTRDMESTAMMPDGVPTWIDAFLTPRSSTSVQYSMRHDLRYSDNDIQVNALYSRISPEYSSMGSSQLLSDWQEFKLDTRLALLRRRLQLGGFLSHRNNNLDKERYLTTRQFSGGGTINLSTWRGVYLNAMYSFMLESNDATQIEEMKRMLTHALFIQPSFEFYGNSVIHHVDITASIQTTRDFIGFLFPSLDFSTITAGFNYFASLTELFTILAGYTLVSNANALDLSTRHISSARLMWDFFDNRFSTSFSATHTAAFAEIHGSEDSKRFDLQLDADYKFSPSEHVRMNIRSSAVSDITQNDRNELTGSITYIRGL